MDKPIMRGWLHAAVVPLALIVTAALSYQVSDDPILLTAILIYGVSLVGSYLASAAFHLGTWSGRSYSVFHALDRAFIFLLIAGTYTPIVVGVLDGWWRIVVLVVVWTVAGLGAGLSGLLVSLPRWVSTSLYLALGWFAVTTAPSLAAALSPPLVGLIVAGGVFYSIGAVIYARKRPDPLPRWFGYHEVFHVFVIAGSTAFLLVIWDLVSTGPL
ncbi:MAG: hemolysin III family protein [Dehalococcoidia bacterium]